MLSSVELHLDPPLTALLVTAGVLVCVQIRWIRGLQKRNKRLSLAAPMTSKAFQAELDKIFCDDT